MKKILPLALVCIISSWSYAQDKQQRTKEEIQNKINSTNDSIQLEELKLKLQEEYIKLEQAKLKTKQAKKIVDSYKTEYTPPKPPTPTPVSKLDKNGIDIIKVETSNLQYNITYFDKDGNLKKFTTNFKQDSIYSNSKLKYLSFSIMVVPFKVRPAIDGYKQYVKADLKTVGLYIGGINKVFKQYLMDGSINEYKISAGWLFAPSAEEFNSKNTGGKITDTTTNLVFSNGLTIAGTYKNINFAFIPIGFDIGLTKDSKSWIYNKKYWFGFGLGLDSKLIGF